jgi:hypothetical protein
MFAPQWFNWKCRSGVRCSVPVPGLVEALVCRVAFAAGMKIK